MKTASCALVLSLALRLGDAVRRQKAGILPAAPRTVSFSKVVSSHLPGPDGALHELTREIERMHLGEGAEDQVATIIRECTDGECTERRVTGPVKSAHPDTGRDWVADFFEQTNAEDVFPAGPKFALEDLEEVDLFGDESQWIDGNPLVTPVDSVTRTVEITEENGQLHRREVITRCENGQCTTEVVQRDVDAVEASPAAFGLGRATAAQSPESMRATTYMDEAAVEPKLGDSVGVFRRATPGIKPHTLSYSKRVSSRMPGADGHMHHIVREVERSHIKERATLPSFVATVIRECVDGECKERHVVGQVKPEPARAVPYYARATESSAVPSLEDLSEVDLFGDESQWVDGNGLIPPMDSLSRTMEVTEENGLRKKREVITSCHKGKCTTQVVQGREDMLAARPSMDEAAAPSAPVPPAALGGKEALHVTKPCMDAAVAPPPSLSISSQAVGAGPMHATKASMQMPPSVPASQAGVHPTGKAMHVTKPCMEAAEHSSVPASNVDLSFPTVEGMRLRQTAVLPEEYKRLGA